MKILLKLMYVGDGFFGYQVQNGKLTVQGCLCDAARAVYGCECDVTGCSRTDSGVHANEFYAALAARDKRDILLVVPLSNLPLALNSHLPEGISVVSASAVDDSFHPRYDVKYKEYIYKIWNAPERNPFLCGFAYHYPIKLPDGFMERMNAAAKRIEGEHDFAAFMAKGSSVSSTVRNVKYCTVERDGALIKIRISADGFLYNMVRIIAGTLLEAAKGNITPDDIDEIIASKDRKKAGATAPACGLYLNRVVY